MWDKSVDFLDWLQQERTRMEQERQGRVGLSKEEQERELERLKADGVTGFDPINHGNAWSVYFPDPEGNRIELYCVTPWHVQQPFAEKFDLDAPLEEIRARTLALIQADPSHCPRPEWISTMRTKLGA